jgi:hypothetical protein
MKSSVFIGTQHFCRNVSHVKSNKFANYNKKRKPKFSVRRILQKQNILEKGYYWFNFNRTVTGIPCRNPLSGLSAIIRTR